LCSLSAVARASWSAPVTVSPVGQNGFAMPIAFDDSGVLRTVWGVFPGAFRFAQVERGGRVRHRVQLDRFRSPYSRPSLTQALAGGRTLIMWEAGSATKLRTVDARSGTVDALTSRNTLMNHIGVSVVGVAGGGALACWVQLKRPGSRAQDSRVQVVAIDADGAIGEPVTVADPDDSDEWAEDCSLVTNGRQAVVVWESDVDNHARVSVRALTAAGEPAGDPLSILPPDMQLTHSPGPQVLVTDQGRIAVVWSESHGGRDRRGRPVPGPKPKLWMRWIAADGTMEEAFVLIEARPLRMPAVDLQALDGDRIVAFLRSRGEFRWAYVDADGIGRQHTYFRAPRGAGTSEFSVASNGRDVTVAFDVYRSRRNRSLYAATWSPSRTRVARLARSRGGVHPSGPLVAVNERGDSVVQYNANSGRFPFQLGIRAVFGP
jgi:hypothetical protein